METVGELLSVKGRAVRTIPSGAPIQESIRRMSHWGVGSLIVFEGSSLVGIITWHDVLRSLAEDASRIEALPVSAVMTSGKFIASTESASLLEAEELIFAHRIGHLLVLRDSRVVGVLSRSDFLRWHVMDAEGVEAALHRRAIERRA